MIPLEELSINAWPALQTLVYDGWIIRLSGGYGNRANSINPLYPSALPLEEKFAKCKELFSSQGLLTTYKLTGHGKDSPPEHGCLDQALAEMNYRVINETSMQVCAITADNTAPGAKAQGKILLSDSFSEGWIQSVIAYNTIEEAHRPILRGILGNIKIEKIIARIEREGEIIACGYGAIENGYVGLYDIVVKKEERGKGHGEAVVRALLAEAHKRGIQKSYLQVMLNNPVALSLYKKLGYTEQYRYWYRKEAP